MTWYVVLDALGRGKQTRIFTGNSTAYFFYIYLCGLEGKGMLSIKNNLQAGNASRQFGINNSDSAKSTEKLSSGYRINRSADDAAGLSISEKMRRQIRGLSQASTNSQDGISLVQTAEGALNEVHEMLQRANELTIKAANGTLSDTEREMIDDEIQKMKASIDGTADNTEFNGIKLFPPNGMSPKTTAASEIYHYDLKFDLSAGTVAVNKAAAAGGLARAGGDPLTTGSVLADTIGNVLIPNAVNQILVAFPALEAAVGNDKIDMALDVSFLDGPNNTLAYAQFTYTSGGKPISMGIKVDVADFTDADAQGTGSRTEVLESTIAHELMHSVMQYTMTDGMSGRNGKGYPEWFVEGTAQLAGGGFTTGWNDWLKNLTNGISSGDTANDGAIKNYLKSEGINSRPYGHGYLAAAYAGYLANGKGIVSGNGIAAGMNQIFADILNNNKSLDEALKAQTGYTSADLESLFRDPDNDLAEFVRELSIASKGGAGSVIATSLGTGGADIVKDDPTAINSSPFRIDPDLVLVDLDREGPRIILQVGGEAGENLFIRLYQMSSGALGLWNTNTKTREDAVDAINQIRDAIGYVSGVRSAYGAVQNRLEHTIGNLDNTAENTTSAESRIRDTDIAKEMVNYSNIQIIRQAGQSMMAQANQQPQSILSLLQ